MGWFGSKNKPQPKVATLGDANSMYYNEELKMWVEKGKEEEARKEKEASAAPPKMAVAPVSAPGEKRRNRYVNTPGLTVSQSTSSLASLLPPGATNSPPSSQNTNFLIPQQPPDAKPSNLFAAYQANGGDKHMSASAPDLSAAQGSAMTSSTGSRRASAAGDGLSPTSTAQPYFPFLPGASQLAHPEPGTTSGHSAVHPESGISDSSLLEDTASSLAHNEPAPSKTNAQAPHPTAASPAEGNFLYADTFLGQDPGAQANTDSQQQHPGERNRYDGYFGETGLPAQTEVHDNSAGMDAIDGYSLMDTEGGVTSAGGYNAADPEGNVGYLTMDAESNASLVQPTGDGATPYGDGEGTVVLQSVHGVGGSDGFQQLVSVSQVQPETETAPQYTVSDYAGWVQQSQSYHTWAKYYLDYAAAATDEAQAAEYRQYAESYEHQAAQYDYYLQSLSQADLDAAYALAASNAATSTPTTDAFAATAQNPTSVAVLADSGDGAPAQLDSATAMVVDDAQNEAKALPSSPSDAISAELSAVVDGEPSQPSAPVPMEVTVEEPAVDITTAAVPELLLPASESTFSVGMDYPPTPKAEPEQDLEEDPVYYHVTPAQEPELLAPPSEQLQPESLSAPHSQDWSYQPAIPSATNAFQGAVASASLVDGTLPTPTASTFAQQLFTTADVNGLNHHDGPHQGVGVEGNATCNTSAFPYSFPAAHLPGSSTFFAAATGAASAASSFLKNSQLHQAAQGLQSKGRNLITTVATHVTTQGKEILGMSSSEAFSEEFFYQVVNSSEPGKLSGPMTWDLPEDFENFSDEDRVRFCQEWSRRNPGVQYSPDLLKKMASSDAGSEHPSAIPTPMSASRSPSTPPIDSQNALGAAAGPAQPADSTNPAAPAQFASASAVHNFPQPVFSSPSPAPERRHHTSDQSAPSVQRAAAVALTTSTSYTAVANCTVAAAALAQPQPTELLLTEQYIATEMEAVTVPDPATFVPHAEEIMTVLAAETELTVVAEETVEAPALVESDYSLQVTLAAGLADGVHQPEADIAADVADVQPTQVATEAPASPLALATEALDAADNIQASTPAVVAYFIPEAVDGFETPARSGPQDSMLTESNLEAHTAATQSPAEAGAYEAQLQQVLGYFSQVSGVEANQLKDWIQSCGLQLVPVTQLAESPAHISTAHGGVVNGYNAREAELQAEIEELRLSVHEKDAAHMQLQKSQEHIEQLEAQLHAAQSQQAEASVSEQPQTDIVTAALVDELQTRVVEQNAQVTDLQAKLADSQSQVAAKDARTTELESLLSSRDAEVAQLRQLAEAASSKDTDVQQLHAQLAEQEAELAQLRESAATATAKDGVLVDLQTQLARQASEIEQLHQQQQELSSSQLVAAEQQIAQLQVQLAERDAQIQELQAELVTKDADLALSTSAVEELELVRAQLADKDAEATQLQAQLALKDSELEELQQQLSAKQAEVDQLQQQVSSQGATAAVDFDQLQQQLAAKDAELQQVRAELAAAEDAFSAAQAKADEKDAENATLQAQLALTDTDASAASAEQVAQLQAQLAQLQQQLDAKTTEISNLQADLERQRMELQDVRVEMDDKDALLNEVCEDVERLKAEKERLQSELDELSSDQADMLLALGAESHKVLKLSELLDGQGVEYQQILDEIDEEFAAKDDGGDAEEQEEQL